MMRVPAAPSVRRALLASLILSMPLTAAAQPYAFVAGPRSGGTNNRGVQVLTVIDVPTRAKVAAIALGETCLCVGEHAAVSADGSRVFVSNWVSNTVSVIDVATLSVVKTLSVHPLPGSIAANADGSRIYVNAFINPGAGYVVHVVDVATNATVATIPLNVPQSGSGMAISPDGSRLYVTNQALNGSNIKVIDTSTNTVIATIPTGLVPRGIDVTPDGQFAYVAVQNANAVSVVSTATNAVIHSVGVGSLPSYVRVLPNGQRSYTNTNAQGNGLSAMSTATGTVIGTVPAILPRQIDFTPDSSTGVIAADGRVYMFDTATHAIVANIPFATGTEGNPMYVVIPQAVPPAPDPPTNLGVSSIVGNTVTLRWNAASGGGPLNGYALEGGIGPGQVLASIPTGSTSPIFTFTAPNGAFYVRMHAVGPGGKSAPSNEIQLFVNTPNAPSPPANLLGLADGNFVALTWRNTYAGGSPASVALEVTGATNVTLPLGLSDTFAFDGVPPGTYTFSVRATNSAGVAGLPSNAVTLTFPASCSGAPHTPTNLLAYRQGRTLFVSWDGPASGPAPTSYVLHVTGAFVGDVPVAGKSISGSVGAGVYGLSVSASNACGASTPTAPQVVAVP